MNRETSEKGLPRRARITRSQEFREAFSGGVHAVGRLMIVWLRKGEGSRRRLGVVAGKRTFRRAVDRSRVKRLLREVYRLNRAGLEGDSDVVLVARRRLLGAGLPEASEELVRLSAKLGLAKNPPRKR